MDSGSHDIYLGIDVGSVSTKMVALEGPALKIRDSHYIRTTGNPVKALRTLMERLSSWAGPDRIRATATTGSGRNLAAALLNAGIAKNEITTHALAAVRTRPDVHTVVEIGGQDSKMIIVNRGMAVDFAMNTVCAAGTGSFLDQQAGRLGIRVEDMGPLAITSTDPTPVSGRCTVFAETDMIHKQQVGIPTRDIVAGLCRSLVRNYLAGVARGKTIRPPVVFQGGVAANQGIVREFELQTGLTFHVSPHYGVAGAYGAALLASMSRKVHDAFHGFEMLKSDYSIRTFVCNRCEEACSVIRLIQDGTTLAYWNDRCGMYSSRGREG